MNHSAPHSSTKTANPTNRSTPRRCHAPAAMSSTPIVPVTGKYHGTISRFRYVCTKMAPMPSRKMRTPTRKNDRRGVGAAVPFGGLPMNTSRVSRAVSSPTSSPWVYQNVARGGLVLVPELLGEELRVDVHRLRRRRVQVEVRRQQFRLLQHAGHVARARVRDEGQVLHVADARGVQGEDLVLLGDFLGRLVRALGRLP